MDGNLEDIAPRRILQAPGAISVHGGFSSGEPRIRVLRSGAEDCTDWARNSPNEFVAMSSGKLGHHLAI